MTTLPDKPNLRPQEVADFLQVNLSTVYRLIDENELPAFKLTAAKNSSLRIPRDLFLDWHSKRLPKRQNGASE